MSSVSAEPISPEFYCSECGRKYPVQDLARFGTSMVCGDCKPRFVQRMQEGATVPGTYVYGGFWRRFAAILIDGIIMMVVLLPVNAVLGGMAAKAQPSAQFTFLTAYVGVTWLLSLVLNCAYQVYFLSQKSATPGKMVLGLKVITASGGPISPARAAGRYFAYLLSGLTLLIGYIMAAFDSQKRALHDHICSTRVIRAT